MNAGRANVALDAVVLAVTDDRPRVLTVGVGDQLKLPSGPLADDPTLERGMRRLIDEQTGLSVGYVEQLYTFGDRDRDPSGDRLIGVAYLVLTREAPTSAEWVDAYDLFPWEDRRVDSATVASLTQRVVDWADTTSVDGQYSEHESGSGADRRTRVQIAFGRAETPWDSVRALERYELLYEAQLVHEWYRDHGVEHVEDPPLGGKSMSGDHRRVVATALSRVRGKITYRPVVFDLMPDAFTLAQLRRTVEALAGTSIHTQNFRRLVDRAGLVEGTGEQATTGGRPAELFRFREEVLTESDRPGLGRW